MATDKLKPLTQSVSERKGSVALADRGRKNQSQTPNGDLLTPQEYEGVNDARLVKMHATANRRLLVNWSIATNDDSCGSSSVLFAMRRLVRDLAQETFLRVYGKLEMFDRLPAIWSVAFSDRRQSDSRLSAQTKTTRSLGPLLGKPCSEKAARPECGRSSNPPEPARRGSRTVLAEIPENYRSVLILRDLENFSTSEIAAILDPKRSHHSLAIGGSTHAVSKIVGTTES